MLHNLLENKQYVYTAGKITIASAVTGLLIFAFIFLFNAGTTELMKVEAQTATTSLTVLNTPPEWVQLAFELVESSSATPTNSGTVVSWRGIANDPNEGNYYLIVCSTSATPTAVNSNAPFCASGIQWGVSALTPSNTAATVSTTTTELSPFAQSNIWYGWVCDGATNNARCNNTFSQGLNATNSSPFIVNFRPTFTAFSNTSPAVPGATVNFQSTSTDPDGNTIRLIVCSSSGYSTTSNTCTANTLATTTGSITTNASALYQLPPVIRDQNYDAFGFVVDQFGHEALGFSQGANSPLTVSNVAPTVLASSITLASGTPISLTQGGQQTTGIRLDFETTDANSCSNASNLPEVTGFAASVYHAPFRSTSTCSGTNAGDYNANFCYTSAVATSTWNINCTASSTSCLLNGEDPTTLWSCTFPLWHIANPTDSISQFETNDWRAAVAGIDDNNATGTQTQSASGVELNSFPFFSLLNPAIPYGSLEPGQTSGTLNASTTIRTLGNTGLNQLLQGEDMCNGFTVASECLTSASSTIPAAQQQYGTSSVAYGSGVALSSSTPTLLQLRIPKSTSTSTPESRPIHWGIGVPSTITFAGSYTGLNTFQLAVSSSTNW